MGSPVQLTQSDVAAVREIVAQRCGFFLGEPHERYLEQRVSERMHELRAEFPAYLERLQGSPPESGELQALVERLCIHETRFMRDPADFRALACFVLPQLRREMRATGRRRLRVVSAGCSTGQEAYSLAMILEEAKPEIGEAQVDILGLDLSAEALERARTGRYAERDVAVLDPWRRRRYFVPAGDQLEVVPWLRERVRFLQANLAKDLPISQVEIIFCRNVLIYFTPAQRQAVIRSLLSALRLGGYLIVGSADSMWAHRDVLRAYRTSGTTVFQRVKSMNAARAEAAAPAAGPNPAGFLGRSIRP